MHKLKTDGNALIPRIRLVAMLLGIPTDYWKGSKVHEITTLEVSDYHSAVPEIWSVYGS